MKKLLPGIIVCVFVLTASSAMAKGVKVPKNLCLDYTLYTDYHNLAMKSVGSVVTADAKVKVYTVNGWAWDTTYGLCPVSGTAYVLPGTTTLHASYGGKKGFELNQLRQWEVTYDLATSTGVVYTRVDFSDGTRFIGTGAEVQAGDCSQASIDDVASIDSATTSEVGP